MINNKNNNKTIQRKKKENNKIIVGCCVEICTGHCETARLNGQLAFIYQTFLFASCRSDACKSTSCAAAALTSELQSTHACSSLSLSLSLHLNSSPVLLVATTASNSTDSRQHEKCRRTGINRNLTNLFLTQSLALVVANICLTLQIFSWHPLQWLL